MGYREYFWVIYSPTDANDCVNYALNTWRRVHQHEPELFSQERFERTPRLEVQVTGDKASRRPSRHLICTLAPLHGPEIPCKAMYNCTTSGSSKSREYGTMAQDKIFTDLHHRASEKDQKPLVANGPRELGEKKALKKYHKQATSIVQSQIHLKDRPKLPRINLLEKWSKKAETTIRHPKDRTMLPALFTIVAKSLADEDSLKDTIYLSMKRIFNRKCNLPTGTRRLIWTCVRIIFQIYLQSVLISR